MKKIYLPLLAFCFSINQLQAQLVWNGPTITFTKLSHADPTVAANQDRITPNVWLTRAPSGGIYNIKTEAIYSSPSPADTEWAYGTLNNYASLTYRPWVIFNEKNPPGMLNRDAVVHLVSDNIYIGIKFLSWDIRPESGGGFSYERTTVATLPVTLKGFAASLRNNSAVLQWKTAAEINNNFFEIEHSSNGTTFKPVGRINGAGSSSVEKTYSFTHSNLTSQKNYYRLVQYDNDGTVKYSQVVLLSLKENLQIQIKPNPTTSIITVTASTLIQQANYLIHSAAGQIVKRGVLTHQQIDVQQLPKGQYWLSIISPEGDARKSMFIKN